MQNPVEETSSNIRPGGRGLVESVRVTYQALVWIVCVIDRHVDPVIEAWTEPGRAIERCRELVGELASDPGEVEEIPVAGWLYHCEYGTEGDHGYVFESTLR